MPLAFSLEHLNDMDALMASDPFVVAMEAVYYDIFYRRTGIRTYQKLVTPVFWNIDKFELPKNSIIHYIPDNAVESGIAHTHLFLRKATAMILSEHVTTLQTQEGAPIRTPITPQLLITEYRKNNRRIRTMHKYETAFRDEKTVAVINYALLNKLYRYRHTRRTRIFKYNNLMNTLIAKVNELAAVSTREQYIEMTIPKVLPTKQLLTRASLNFNIQIMNDFPDDRALFLLEIWKWLGEDREKSLLNQLTPQAVSRMQIVWQESGKYTIMSLGFLDKWRKSSEGGSVAPKQMQLAFLKFLNSMFDIKSATAKTTIETTVTENDDGEEETEVTGIVMDGEEMDELLQVEQQAKEDLAKQEAEDLDFDIDEELPTTGTSYIPREELDDLPSPPVDPAPLSTPVIERADDLLEMGLISVPEHRRFSKLANAYESLPDPYGSGKTLGEAMRPDPAVIADLREDSIPEIKSVIDKSMLKSTLQNFDKNYIDKVMKADVLSMVTSINKAGVAVTDYRIETRKDANSHFEVHSVRLTPVGGAPSTLTFTMPVVNNRGEFKDRGNKYRMRKQRADLPIRKITSSRVGLTTYYSKLFVDRSERKVDDYGKWLVQQITLLATEGKIKNVGFDNVFSQELICPRPYAALSTFFTHFDHSDSKFIWDVIELTKVVGPALVKSSLRSGEIPCGVTKTGETLIMSDTGVIYVNGTGKIIGTIEEILGLDVSRAPVEICLLDIMGKQIPLGVILGYYFGFSNLMRKLKVTYRSIKRGSALELQPDEFTVKFKDQTIIIPKSERLAGLVIGSFNTYKNSISSYDLAEFDRKDVYAPILDMEGLGARYYRELELLLAMYIDPISEELLIGMGEPTYFPALLLRAAELLITDHHPSENDSKYRRIRGYERMPGHLYSQIVNGLRYYKAGANNPKAKVDINPRAVQIKIGEDPSVTLVDELNVIQNLKEVENLTFAGTGGRSGRTMVRRTRAFDKSELGVVSESTVDSQDVGVTTFLSPNPKLANLRGVIKPWEFNEDEASSLFSTSALLSPGADGDD